MVIYGSLTLFSVFWLDPSFERRRPTLFRCCCWGLLAFNIVFAFIAGGKETAWKVAPPQVPALFGVAFAVGVVLGNFGSGMWYEDYLGVPGGLFSSIWYVIFFGAGVVARRNAWLDAVPKLPFKQAAFCVVAACSLCAAASRSRDLWVTWPTLPTPIP